MSAELRGVGPSLLDITTAVFTVNILADFLPSFCMNAVNIANGSSADIVTQLNVPSVGYFF